MTIAFHDAFTPQAAASGSPGPAFIPGASRLLAFSLNGVGTTPATYTGSGGGSWTTLFSSSQTGRYVSAGYNLSGTSGSQTLTITDVAATNPTGFVLDYSGVLSVTNGAAISIPTPGAGNAISGTAIVVPTGSTLVALCFGITASSVAPTATNGTQRRNGTATGSRGYCIADYPGTGASVTPTFSSTSATDSFIIIQMILNPVVNPVIQGTAHSSSYLSGALTWTPSPQPAAGSGIIIPFTVENCGGIAAPTVTITDNQMPSNVYTNSGVATNPSGNGTIGGLTTGCASLQSLPAYVGTLTFTLTPTGGSGRNSILVNHLEVPNGIGAADQTGTHNGGATAHNTETVTASGANTNPVSVVVAQMMLFNGSGQFAVGSDPPSFDYTSLAYANLSGNSTSTDTTTGDIGWKLTSVVETSSALWPTSGTWQFSGQTCSSIVSFPIAAYALPLAQGSFSLGGQVLGAVVAGTATTAFILLCAPGSFNLVGSPAYSGFQLDADEGVFSLTGQSMDITVSQFMSLDQGNFGMAGQALGAAQGYVFSLDEGGFSLTGRSVALAVSSPTAIKGKGKPGGRVILHPKKLGETSIYQFDFISALGSNEVISSGVVMAEVFSGTDPSPSSIVSGGAAVVGTQLQQKITGGVLGVIYELLAIATTSLGNTIEISGYLAITPDLV